jgi:hypothetical protein
MRKSYDESGNIISGVERYLTSLKSTLGASKSKEAALKGIGEVYNTFFKDFADEEARGSASALWTMPEEAMTSGGLARQRLNMLQATYNGGKEYSEEVAEQMIKNNRVFYQGSGQVSAKGTGYATDLAKDLYGNLGILYPGDAGVDRFVRGEFGVSASAKKAASQLGFSGEFGNYYKRLERKMATDKYKNLIYGGLDAADARAYSAPQLMTFFAKPAEDAAFGGPSVGFNTQELNRRLTAEAAVVDSSVASKMMEVERVTQKKIRLDEGFQVNKKLSKALEGTQGKFAELGENAIRTGSIGVEVDTGRMISMSDNLNQQVIGAKLSGENEATVFIKERYSLANGDRFKMFGEEGRPVARAAGAGEIPELARLAGYKGISNQQKHLVIAEQKIEQFTSGKVLSKNTFARMTQQVEALSAIAATRAGDSAMKEEVLSLLANPGKFLGIADTVKGSNYADLETKLDTRMISAAKRFGFTEEELGLTFGLMKQKHADSLGIGKAVRDSAGVIGLSKSRVGNILDDFVGQTATLDVGGFRNLTMKGEAGQRLA